MSKRDPFKKIKKTRKKPNEFVDIQLTENEARTFLASIQSCKDRSLVRVASKISGQLGRIAHLRSVGLLEVLKNVK